MALEQKTLWPSALKSHHTMVEDTCKEPSLSVGLLGYDSRPSALKPHFTMVEDTCKEPSLSVGLLGYERTGTERLDAKAAAGLRDYFPSMSSPKSKINRSTKDPTKNPRMTTRVLPMKNRRSSFGGNHCKAEEDFREFQASIGKSDGRPEALGSEFDGGSARRKSILWEVLDMAEDESDDENGINNNTGTAWKEIGRRLRDYFPSLGSPKSKCDRATKDPLMAKRVSPMNCRRSSFGGNHTKAEEDFREFQASLAKGDGRPEALGSECDESDDEEGTALKKIGRRMSAIVWRICA